MALANTPAHRGSKNAVRFRCLQKSWRSVAARLSDASQGNIAARQSHVHEPSQSRVCGALIRPTYAQSAPVAMADVCRNDTEDTFCIRLQPVAQIRHRTFGSELICRFCQVTGGAGVQAAGQRTRKYELQGTVTPVRHLQLLIFEKIPSGFFSASCRGT